MKGGIKLADFQNKNKKVEEVWVLPQPCLICKKVIPGAYGMWSHGWSCSKSCEQEVERSMRAAKA